mgnify:CR=1 FL=1
MVIILNAVGVPIEGLSLILPVDRLLDSCRTPVNLWSNSIATVVVAKAEGEPLVPHLEGTDEDPMLGISKEEIEKLEKKLERVH